MRRFLIVFTTLHICLTYYIGARSADHWGLWIILLFFAILVWSLPAFHWRRDEEQEPNTLKVRALQASFVSMGAMSWLLVLTVARDLTLVATYFISPEMWAKVEQTWTGAFTFGFAFAMLLLGSWRTFNGPIVKHVKIPLPESLKSLHGFKIAQITDLHVGPTIGKAYVDRVVSMIDVLQPNVTVLTGDIVDGSIREHKNSIQSFSKIRGPVFYSLGNHEYYWQIDRWLPEFVLLGARVLINCGEVIVHGDKKIWIGGITDPAAAQFTPDETPNVIRAAMGSESSQYKILLSHRPGFAEAAEKAGFNLQLSGHTHGGQFFPWTIVAHLFHQYLLGLFQHGKMWVYVGPGTGTWGPPMRIGTTPELTCLTLEASS